MISRLTLLVAAIVVSGSACGQYANDRPVQELAACLTAQGWVMYGSVLCAACRAQRELFAEAVEELREVECNPNVHGAETDLCVARGVRKFPTWIREQNGSVVERVENFQRLEDLAQIAGCK